MSLQGRRQAEENERLQRQREERVLTVGGKKKGRTEKKERGRSKTERERSKTREEEERQTAEEEFRKNWLQVRPV